ncbi:cell division protein FtsQ/DivIB [Streptococcus sp. S784/96/1]|uniref:cell division protein FtsQ/DivIB n=1 Tax=Streptococcus sp. S784/96/1 TaxID=2653499 RepID=UPI00138A2BC1|nr:FtsQ-type POTRA domain-containing protein [Streptococcus sp. S784/96/1]
MTKENEMLEPEKSTEKTEWQKRHEEFVARKATKKIEEDKLLTEKKAESLEEEKELSGEEISSEPFEKETQEEPLNEEDATEELEVESELEDIPNEEPEAGLSEITEVKNSSDKNSIDDKLLKQQLKADKKAKRLEQRLQTRPLRLAKVKVASITFVALITIIISGFILSPYSKKKIFNVTGLEHVDRNAILISTGIQKSDYISTVFFKKKSTEQAILAANPWVKQATISYRFPNVFDVTIIENRIIAYAQTESGYQPVLENGVRMPVISESQLPEHFLTVNLTDEKAVQSLVVQLAKLDEKLVANIQVVNPVTDAATKDLILLEVKDGHRIRVPLSQIDVKLPFYAKIAGKLTSPSIIDMEVGIFTTNETIEATMAQEKVEREEAKKKAEEEAKKSEKSAEDGDNSEEGTLENPEETTSQEALSSE